jgi:hypothetical protein
VLASWQKVWREGFAPEMSLDALKAIKAALESDDRRLVQGATSVPPPLMCVQDWPCEGACLVGYGGWQGEGLGTVGEVEEYLAERCFRADQRLGEPAACRYLLNHWDGTPRDEAVRDLLPEVELAIREREAKA